MHALRKNQNGGGLGVGVGVDVGVWCVVCGVWWGLRWHEGGKGSTRTVPPRAQGGVVVSLRGI